MEELALLLLLGTNKSPSTRGGPWKVRRTQVTTKSTQVYPQRTPGISEEVDHKRCMFLNLLNIALKLESLGWQDCSWGIISSTGCGYIAGCIWSAHSGGRDTKCDKSSVSRENHLSWALNKGFRGLNCILMKGNSYSGDNSGRDIPRMSKV